MANAVAAPEKQKRSEVAVKPRPLSRSRDFPFFLSRLRDDFDSLFERFAMTWPRGWGEVADGWRWGLDVKDQDDAVIIRAEAPGFEPGDFDVQVHDGELTLRASRKTESKKEEGEEWSQRECFQSMTLPAGIDKNKVEATYRNGILTIKLPKTPEGKSQRVAGQGCVG